MKTKLIIVLFLLAGYGIVQAQLSDRVNDPVTIKFGTRPMVGNLGLSFGTSYDEIQNITDPNKAYSTLPVVCFKYYHSNYNVLTIGFKTNSTSSKIKGDIDPNVNGGTRTGNVEIDKSMELMLVPGMEKHFGHSNIFDVYIGARIPLGMVTDKVRSDSEQNNGDYSYYTETQHMMVYGFDAFVGLQIFLFHLPIALGGEIEASGLTYAGNKSKVEIDQSAGGIGTQQKYYTSTLDPLNQAFSKLHARSGSIESDIRITLTYFFKK